MEKIMKKTKTHRRTFWWTVCVVLVTVCLMDLAVWYAMGVLGKMITPLLTSAPGQPAVTSVIQTFHSLENYFLLIGMPSSFLLFLLVVGLIRMIYKTGNKKENVTEKRHNESKGKKDASQERARNKRKEQRLFLHMISLLQRKGRLVDFFAEDLGSYEDAQIGAAVREIHATCRQVVEKSLSLKPVIESMEGETVTVEEGFDPGAIKLVGKVSGSPPFSGVLRHRGWQAGKMEMPTFSGDQEATVIAPAEVEIA